MAKLSIALPTFVEQIHIRKYLEAQVNKINDLIQKKLDHFPEDVHELALEAIKLSESGLSDSSVSEQLRHIVRRILRKKESK